MINLIPIGDIVEPDRLIWPWNRNGVCSVKSGYYWKHLRSSRSIVNNCHSSHQVNSDCWKIIWNLPTLPKIRAFFWRALSNAIPTYLNLFRRKLIRSPLCPICHNFEESIEHILLLCPWVTAVWFGSPLGYRISNSSITTLDNWLLDIHKSSSNCYERNSILKLLTFSC